MDVERVAYHEAGHVVVCILLDIPFKYVTIVPTGDSGGHVRMLDSKVNMKECLALLCSGSVAEHLKFGEQLVGQNSFAGGDVLGMDTCISCLPEPYVKEFMEEAIRDTIKLLKDDAAWLFVVGVATALMQKKTLTFREVYDLLEGETWAVISPSKEL